MSDRQHHQPGYNNPLMPDYPEEPVEPGAGSAFVKGGCGCLVIFLVLAMIFFSFGGSVSIDLGNPGCLFVLGGGLAAIMYAIYRYGVEDGRRR